MFELQIRAIRYAIKALQQERVTALEAKNQEWADDVDAHRHHESRGTMTAFARANWNWTRLYMTRREYRNAWHYLRKFIREVTK